MADNLTLESKKVLCDMINRNNVESGSSLTPELVDFGIPSQSNDAKNTDITVIAKSGSGYTGQEVINYNRLHLTTEIGNPYVASAVGRNLIFPIGEALKIADIVPAINARLGINLVAADFTDGDLPEFTGTPNEILDVQLLVKADSLCYRGSLTFQLKAEDILLSTVIVNKVMDGLTYQPPA